ncbi:MAG: sigma-70 family RNA polymerase sigma factor [Mesorhizobium sp.]|nr:MAG: sigma-70 family RNA polymerase sigma factor [Mesorhizobium sp.]
MTNALLTKEEEYALAISWRDHKDVKAMKKIIASHLPLVHGMAKKFAKFDLEHDDLVQEGAMGLKCALDRFDPDMGNRFSTFARWWVISHMQTFILNNYCIVRGPKGHDAKRRFYRGDRARHASLDMPVGEDGNMAWVDILEGDGPNPEEAAERTIDGERAREIMALALAKLSRRSQDIIRRRVMSDDPVTLEALGEEYGVSRERIRQIEAKALEDLRAALAVKRRRGLVMA